MLTRLTLVAVAALVLASSSVPVRAAQLTNDQQAVRAAYVAFVDAQNAHNITAIQGMLWDSPKTVWLTTGGPIYGTAAILGRFKLLFAGVWSARPDYTNTDINVRTPMTADVIGPISITATTITGGTPITSRAIVVTMFQQVGNRWMVAGLVPVAASVRNF
jgi:ketosteroid isomerase-like protein